MYAVMREVFGTRESLLETLEETARRYEIDPGALRQRRREQQDALDEKIEKARKQKTKMNRSHLRPVK